MPDRRAWLAQLPKAELHLHLEGAIPPDLAVELAGVHQVSLPPSVVDAAARGTAYRYDDFRGFIEIYLAITDLLRTPDDYRRVVEALGARLRAQGVVWAEVTFTPLTHVNRGVDPAQFMAGLGQGRAAVRAAGGPELRWVFDIVRHFPDQAEPTLALARAHADHDTGGGVIGLGLAGPEARSAPYERYAQVFAEARRAGLHALPHAGEHRGPESIRAAITQLGARRIGHGVRAVEDPALVAELVAMQLPLEICPHSNLALGVVHDLAAHPVEQLRRAGVALSLATDDPPLFGVSLLDEYERCADTFGWGRDVLADLAAASLAHACMREDDRRTLARLERGLTAGGESG